MKRFLYLVQSKGALRPELDALQSDDSDVLTLTWGEEVPGTIYLPKSTWTQGRNRLYREAMLPEFPKYQYYTFLDEDVSLLQGDWRMWEQALLKFEPAVAVPLYPEYGKMAATSNLALEAHRCTHFDAMCNAFHRDVLDDGLLIPYIESYDAQSWFISQWLLIHLARFFLAPYTIQVNTVHIENPQHGEYPREADFRKLHTEFFKTVTPFGRLLSWLLPARVVGRASSSWEWLRFLYWDRYHLPERKSSYRIPSSKRQRVLRATDPLWRGRI